MSNAFGSYAYNSLNPFNSLPIQSQKGRKNDQKSNPDHHCSETVSAVKISLPPLP